MDTISGAQINLTDDDADQMEHDVTAQGEIDELVPHFWREPEPAPDTAPAAEPLFTLAWIFLPPGVEPPPVPPAAASPTLTGPVATLVMAADRVGVPRRTLVAIALAESGLKAVAEAGTSTAQGLLQITEATWISAVDRYGAALGVKVTDRAKPEAQALMGAALVAENFKLLTRRLGRAPSDVEVYVTQFLGGPAGTAVLLAPSAPVMTTLENFYASTKFGSGFAQKIAKANPALLGQPGLRGDGLLAILQARLLPRLAKADQLLAGAAAQPATPPPTGPAKATSAEAPWFEIAKVEQAAGVAEVPGPGSNLRIMEYFSWTSFGEHPDDVPWCGAFVSFCFGKAGEITFGKGFARAADWKNFGTALTTPRTGCLVVLKPQTPKASGHVGFLVSFTATKVKLLGGNQSDKVTTQDFGRDQVVPNGFRSPA